MEACIAPFPGSSLPSVCCVTTSQGGAWELEARGVRDMYIATHVYTGLEILKFRKFKGRDHTGKVYCDLYTGQQRVNLGSRI